ncbi:MAG: hypothetical protein EOP04_25530 [Proteobacteria bacterium]|nr:MAG: hypothetical protein EOP04_25530 [Pseudomonadota bacterium]
MESNNEAIETKSALHNAYAAFVTHRGEVPVSKHTFGRMMAVRGFTEFRNKTSRYWRGLRLLASSTVMTPGLGSPTGEELYKPVLTDDSMPEGSEVSVLSSKAAVAPSCSPTDELLLKNMMGVFKRRPL